MSTCWPGRCPRQPLTCSARLFTRGVSTARARTAARCHSSRRDNTAGPSITVVPLFLPGVAVAVVAERFPETTLVVIHEAQSPHPLGALPEVQMRHKQPGWTAMHGVKGCALVTRRDSALAVDEVLDRKVCRVTPVAMRHDVRCEWIRHAGRLQQIVEGHTQPGGIELRQLGDAVDSRPDRGLRQPLELGPGPAAEHGSVVLENHAPAFEVQLRRRSRRENRKVLRHVLAGRYAVLGRLLLTPRPEAAGNRWLIHATVSFT